MNLGLTLLLVMPLIGAAIAALMPERQVGPMAAVMTLVQVGFLIPLLITYKSGEGMFGAVDEIWISQLGVHYAVGLDGLNILMVCLTVLGWSVATFSASRAELSSPKLFYMLMALAEVGTLGVFLVQDLILFVMFFDLLLIPFYMLIGIWGQDNELGSARKATATFMIYTLAGSLLMLAASVTLGMLSAAQHDAPLSFLFTDLMNTPVGGSSQNWIFIGFMIALLIKMPIPPLHGWMPITYRSAPLPVLIVLSAVVAKLGAYGFLRIVLPILPSASVSLQTVMLVLSLVAIYYGSVMAFSQDQMRLVIGYSSIAQMGFILLGIFSLDPKGAVGAEFQMLNHGLVVIVLLAMIGFLATRVGSERLSQMGGLAKRAPVFAALFVMTSFATLAMPGTPNFVGEIYILFGAFQTHYAFGVIATGGVILASVYMLRYFQRAMHYRGSAGDEQTEERSRDLSRNDLALVLPGVLILIALAVYPQFAVTRVAPEAGAVAEDAAAVALKAPAHPTELARVAR